MSKCKVANCENDAVGKEYCRKHYMRNWRHGDPTKVLEEHKIKLDYEIDENNCFNITSHKVGHNKYPKLRYENRSIEAHRKIYYEMFGEIEDGLVVRHTCHNRLCINPEHLILGTRADNVQDSVNANRQAKGEKIHTSKLTESKVRQIRALLDVDKRETYKSIGEQFNVTRGAIKDIETGKTWGWVD